MFNLFQDSDRPTPTSSSIRTIEVKRRDGIQPGSSEYTDARGLLGARKVAMVDNSMAMADAKALFEINTNSSIATKKAAIGNLYKSLPDYSIKNSGCRGLDYVSPSKGNLFGRLRRWLDEDYIVIEVSTLYKIITVLNLLLMISVIVMAYLMWYNACTMQVVSTNGEPVSPHLAMFIKVVNDYISPILGGIVFVYGTWRVVKRTTAECMPSTAPGRPAGPRAVQIMPAA